MGVMGIIRGKEGWGWFGMVTAVYVVKNVQTHAQVKPLNFQQMARETWGTLRGYANKHGET